MPRVVLARRAAEEVLACPRPLADAVEGALGLLERDPDAGHPLRGRLRGLRSLRVGSYRVIYVVDGGVVRVATTRHRGARG
ncbi:MAG TPA: type II toxin-antitoxin system RelE/ParE family toxin [Frankiaceae bacterium]|nr:type II toxin-antitoxin system RelE/ParE family toxin [Frankiaceae bacterium]